MSEPKLNLTGGVTIEEIKNIMIPLRDDKGDIQHMSRILVDNDRLIKLVNDSSMSKATKRKVHLTVKRMCESMNSTGMYQYIPDRYKVVIPVLFCMDIMSDSDFIQILEAS
jgi:hypothetical protein